MGKNKIANTIEYQNARKHVERWDVATFSSEEHPVGSPEKKFLQMQYVLLHLYENLPKFLRQVDAYGVHGRVPSEEPLVFHVMLILKLQELSQHNLLESPEWKQETPYTFAFRQVDALSKIAKEFTSGKTISSFESIHEAVCLLLDDFSSLCEEDNFPWTFEMLCKKVTESQF